MDEGNSKHILIIGKHQYMVENLQTLLSAAGFQVVGFTIVASGGKNYSMSRGVATCPGASFKSAQATAVLSNCTKGTSVIFTDIKVKGPDGIRTLNQDLTFMLL